MEENLMKIIAEEKKMALGAVDLFTMKLQDADESNNRISVNEPPMPVLKESTKELSSIWSA
jgi:hypothetical protein